MTTSAGASLIGSLTKPGRAAVEGQVRVIEIRPVERNSVLACEISDATGDLTALFWGRSRIPGLMCGSQVRFRGPVGIKDGAPVMVNPAYEIIPAAVPVVPEAVPTVRARESRPRPVYAAPRRLLKLALHLSGRNRLDLREEWNSHLSGEAGSGLERSRQVRAAAGFVRAAICFRLKDAADVAWRPVDAMLGSRKWSNLIVAAPTIAAALIFVRYGGASF